MEALEAAEKIILSDSPIAPIWSAGLPRLSWWFSLC
jgi:ABC-type oligopeptide transport system substrate-binding subunit